MPKKTTAQKKLEKAQNTLATWETCVDTMDVFDMPEHYASNKETGKYARFTGFMKEWMTWLLTSNEGSNPFAKFESSKNNVPNNWWNIAMDVGNGKPIDPDNRIPAVANQGANSEAREKIFNTFMPAYRALTELHSKRWGVLSWMFNHSQYTAERDTIRALRGTMISLTGCTREDINNRLAEYKKNVPDSGRTPDEREEDSENYRTDRLLDRFYTKKAAKEGLSLDAWKRAHADEYDFDVDYEETELENERLVRHGHSMLLFGLVDPVAEEPQEPTEKNMKELVKMNPVDLDDSISDDEVNVMEKSFVIEDSKNQSLDYKHLLNH